MQDYEKLGVFYLGRAFDPARNAPTDDLILYDSKDLTTHAVCVGMTGSGKTGLCLAMLEEAGGNGSSLDIAGLIAAVQKPPFDKVGAFELETFFPAKERLALAMALNN